MSASEWAVEWNWNGGLIRCRFKVEMSPVNLDRIQSWIDQGRIDRGRLITVKELTKSRCIHGVKRHGVKLLARVRQTYAV